MKDRQNNRPTLFLEGNFQITIVFFCFFVFLFGQAVLEELRRESAAKHASLQEEIDRLKLEKDEVNDTT